MVASENRQRGTWRTGQRTRLIVRWVSRFALYLAVLILAVAFAVPFLWAISSSLKTSQEIFIFPPQWLPSSPQWDNYVEIWRRAPLGTFFLNSTVVAALSVIGQLLSASLVAYGFARFRFPGRDVLFVVVLSTLMLPGQVTIIPVFLIFRTLGWLDTLKPLTVPAFFGGGAFAIFLFRQFFLTIPKELDEAAKIDGANSLWIFFRVIVPLSKPVFVTMAIFSFLGSWNDFFGPLIFLNSEEKFTMPLGLSYFQVLAGVGSNEPTQHLLLAAALTMTIPPMIIFLVLQRYFVTGIVMSGLKG